MPLAPPSARSRNRLLGTVIESEARIRELEDKLADFSAALGRERAERERASHERDEYRKLYELVMLELERVKCHLRAQKKSERVDAQQVQLAFAEVAKLVVPPELAQAIADQENEAASETPRDRAQPRGRHGRNKVPEHLPTERIEIEPPESLRRCACCGEGKVKIGEETSDRLDYRPASLVRVQIARVKYAPSCKCEEGGVVMDQARTQFGRVPAGHYGSIFRAVCASRAKMSAASGQRCAMALRETQHNGPTPALLR